MGVVLFHFGATWLPGGFIGVDVFFVISGYVISRSLFRDVETGAFSIVSFYERRARRILPAFFVVTAATTLAGYFLLFPEPLVDLATSVAAAALFVSNIYFYATAEYFGAAAIETPLLHYWSLGVEEQFYLIFPLIVVAANRRRPGALPLLIVGLAVASLAACEIVRRWSPEAAFYLLPFRAFELLIGCALALKRVPFPRDKRISAAIVTVGVALLFGSMVFVHETMPFPGVLALPACLGTALVIFGADRTTTLPSRILGARALTFLGSISYSLYLVHWPIAVFLTMMRPDLSPTAFMTIGVPASILLAWLSYVLVEQPVRTRRAIFTRKAIFNLAGSSLAILIAVAGSVILSDGAPQRLSPEIRGILSFADYEYRDSFREGSCFLRPRQSFSDLDQASCLPAGKPSVVLWGDSSIAQYYAGLQPLLAKRGYLMGQLNHSGCPPLVGVEVAARPNCKNFNDAALAKLLESQPTTVVLGALWDATDAQLAELDRTIARLTGAGIKVVVLGPPAFYKKAVPTIVAMRKVDGNPSRYADGDLDTEVSVQRDKTMAAHFRDRTDVTYLSIQDSACMPQCILALEDVPLHFDLFHLTDQGSAFYATRMVDQILK